MKKSEHFDLLHFFIIFVFTIIIFFIDDQGKQHKMLISQPVAAGWLQTISVIKFFRVKEMLAILF